MKALVGLGLQIVIQNLSQNSIYCINVSLADIDVYTT